MDINPIVQRLRSELPADWVDIGGAAGLDVAIDAAPTTPVVYVLPLAESAEPGYLAGVHAQPLRMAFGVLIAVQNVSDARGGAAQSELAVRRQQVRTALAGWTLPTDPDATVSFAEGRLMQFENGRLWWMDTYEASTQIWAPAQP
ncbi:MAG: hypothetical protein LCH73_02925 [Proteobacteria bacterium]|nr:hypothetical protein [Pseudomonadota bacterium]